MCSSVLCSDSVQKSFVDFAHYFFASQSQVMFRQCAVSIQNACLKQIVKFKLRKGYDLARFMRLYNV